jgi:hypothetical protein
VVFTLLFTRAEPLDTVHQQSYRGWMTEDPTQMRNQPALTASSGRIWLIVGGLFTLIALAVLAPMTALPPRGVALTAAIAVAVLYVGMVVVRLAVPSGRLRLGLMAAAMLLIAAIALIGTFVVATAQVP